jgi:GxxExxY protein
VDERDRLNKLTEQIMGAAIELHRVVGTGLLESPYEVCLGFELRGRLKVEQQKPLAVVYISAKLDCGHRLDIVVDSSVIVEIKSIERLGSIHEAQLLSYLRWYVCKLGLLINFHVPMLKNGIRRIVNQFPDSTISANSAA